MRIHWPTQGVAGRVGAWRAMQEMQQQGKVRCIGVSNFTHGQLEDLIRRKSTVVVPCVNQIEIHPIYVDWGTIRFCQEKGIVLEAYSPFKQNDEDLMQNKRLLKIAKKHGKTVAQTILRWDYQHGFVSLPRSRSEDHVRENVDIFDFELTAAEMAKIDGMNQMDKACWDPHDIEYE